jgi:acyl-CoA synthetase (AMP-forming)/AMP-acid ligase II
VNAGAWLLEGGESRPEAPAFIHKTRRLTHREWRARVDVATAFLARAGVAKGNRVALLAPNDPDAAAVLLATFVAGGTAVPLAPIDATRRLERMIARTRPVAIFTDGRTAKIAEQIAPEARAFSAADLDGEPAPRNAATTVGRDDPALVLFTSGSTGEPRGVVISHANIVANTTSILASLPIQKDDRMMAILPFCYSFGASILFTHVRAGACLVVNNQFVFADRVLEEMIRQECTSFAGVPSTYQWLLRRSSLPRMRFPHLRYVQQAGGRLAPPFVRELGERLPGTEIWLMYGQTEATARLSCLEPSRLADKSHSIGRPIPGISLQVRRADGSLAAPGEVGEIVARGDSVALGYLDEPAATEETFRDGTLHTGDLGLVDEDGFFVLVDRAKDFLKCAGYRVAVREIEDALQGFEGTIEAAVVGVSDDLQGEAVKAFIVHPDGESARLSFEAYVKRSLLPHLQPRETVFLDALPKTPAGKIARAELKKT